MKRMRRGRAFIPVITVASLCIGGCPKKEEPPKEKATVEKLGSENSNERLEGIDEAEEKYGAK